MCIKVSGNPVVLPLVCLVGRLVLCVFARLSICFDLGFVRSCTSLLACGLFGSFVCLLVCPCVCEFVGLSVRVWHASIYTLMKLDLSSSAADGRSAG